MSAVDPRFWRDRRVLLTGHTGEDLLVPLDEALQATAGWCRELRTGADMRAVTLGQIEAFQYPATSP